MKRSFLIFLAFSLFMLGCGDKSIELKRIADSAYMSDNIDVAINNYRQSIMLKPENPATNLQLGALLVDQGKFSEAKPYLQKAEKLLPNNILVKYDLARLYVGEDDADNAMKYFQNCIAMDSNFSMAYNGMGIVYMRQMEMDKAIEWFKKAIQIDPNFIEAHYNIGIALYRLEKFDDAIAQFVELTNKWPSFKDAYYNITACYRKLKLKTSDKKLQEKYIIESRKYTELYIKYGGVSDMQE
ncbi:MAG: tetratricopeptide repeat protein [Candidatus Coatesbacteria bacterium]|nr:tetratricopeptide repeat protein [Candidatus Coatesbacteria bacterium]